MEGINDEVTIWCTIRIKVKWLEQFHVWRKNLRVGIDSNWWARPWFWWNTSGKTLLTAFLGSNTGMSWGCVPKQRAKAMWATSKNEVLPTVVCDRLDHVNMEVMNSEKVSNCIEILNTLTRCGSADNIIGATSVEKKMSMASYVSVTQSQHCNLQAFVGPLCLVAMFYINEDPHCSFDFAKGIAHHLYLFIGWIPKISNII